MLEILTFTYEGASEIRTLDIDGVVWFVGKDVAKLLGYERPTKAVQDHVDKEDINGIPIQDSISRMQKTPIINESGLYSLILSSKLPEAKKFKHWIIGEVIPVIRKHGAYITPDKIEEVLLNPDTIIKIATALKEEQQKNRKLTATNLVLTEKANTWDERTIIVALIRAFASKRCNDNFVKAWNVFYKRLNYSLNINLRLRRANHANPKIKLLDLLEKSELAPAAKIAVAICE
jgi:prophage antirepressor-like protein